VRRRGSIPVGATNKAAYSRGFFVCRGGASSPWKESRAAQSFGTLAKAGFAEIAEVGDLLEMPARFAIYRAGEPITDMFFPSIACSLS
jgi:hypothetical protein